MILLTNLAPKQLNSILNLLKQETPVDILLGLIVLIPILLLCLGFGKAVEEAVRRLMR